MGAGQAGERLAQHAAGKDAGVAPWRATLDHEDLEVLRERPVLEAVVEHERGRAEPLDRDAAGLVAILAHHHRDAGQALGEQQRLVAGGARVGPHAFAVRHDVHAAGHAPVAAAHHRGHRAQLLQRAHHELHRRGLAAAAEREIADRDHRAGQPAGAQDLEAIGQVADAQRGRGSPG